MSLKDELKKRRFRKYMERETLVAVRQMLDRKQNGHAFEAGTLPDGTKIAMLMVIAPTSWVDQQMEIIAKANGDTSTLEKLNQDSTELKTDSWYGDEE